MIRRQRPAFTLIELVAVLLLVGLLAGAVALSLAHSRRGAQMQEAIELWVHQDRLMRQQARQFNRPQQLVIQMEQGWVRIVDAAEPQQGGLRTQLAEGYRVSRLRLPGVDLTAGELAIPCSARGYTPSYALLLSGPQQQRQWILLTGLSGQMQKVQDEREIEKLFETLAALRPDPD